MAKRRKPRVLDFSVSGMSPIFARLLADLDKAEAAWSKVNSQCDNAFGRAVRAGKRKLASALQTTGKHPLRRATNAAWADVERAEAAVARHRARNYPDVVAKFRLDSYLSGQLMAAASRLYNSAIADAERLARKGGAA